MQANYAAKSNQIHFHLLNLIDCHCPIWTPSPVHDSKSPDFAVKEPCGYAICKVKNGEKKVIGTESRTASLWRASQIYAYPPWAKYFLIPDDLTIHLLYIGIDSSKQGAKYGCTERPS